MEKCEKCGGTGIVYGFGGSSQTCIDCLTAGRLDSYRLPQQPQVQSNIVCKKCNGKKIVKDKDGTSHTCWDCLTSGRLDNHSKNVPDAGIRF